MSKSSHSHSITGQEDKKESSGNGNAQFPVGVNSTAEGSRLCNTFVMSVPWSQPSMPEHVGRSSPFLSSNSYIPPSHLMGTSMSRLNPSQFKMMPGPSNQQLSPQIVNALASLQQTNVLPMFQPTAVTLPVPMAAQVCAPMPPQLGSNISSFLDTALPSSVEDMNAAIPARVVDTVSAPSQSEKAKVDQQINELANAAQEAMKNPEFAPADSPTTTTPTGKAVGAPPVNATSSGIVGSLQSPTQEGRQALFLGADVEPRIEGARSSSLYPSVVDECRVSELLTVVRDTPVSEDSFLMRPCSSIGSDDFGLGLPDPEESAPMQVVSIPVPVPIRKPAKSHVDQLMTKQPPARAVCGIVKTKPGRPYLPSDKKKFPFSGSPQDYLTAILKERGYPMEHMSSANAGYYKKASPLQRASFGSELVKACNTGDVQLLSSMLDCGLSPNPTNNFGDDILHLVCKRGNSQVFQCLVDHGSDLQVADSFGRTPLHHVAWSGNFSRISAKVLLDADANQLLIEDQLQKCPLEYVRAEDWNVWVGFLRQHMDEYWPVGGADTRRMSVLPKDKARPADPSVLSIPLAKEVAAGRITPDAVSRMDEYTRQTYDPDEAASLYDLLCR